MALPFDRPAQHLDKEGGMQEIDVSGLRSVHPRSLFESIKAKTFPPHRFIFEVKNEIKPLDLYSYLYARFGPPNGVQNFLRHDDSDNLFHWDWTVSEKRGLITFLGLTFRTEIHFLGGFEPGSIDREHFLESIKGDFKNYGKQLSEVRSSLEKWVEFVNPFQRIKASIDALIGELEALGLSDEEGPEIDVLDPATREKWNEAGTKYSRGFGLCFGIRAMLPILAEAFVNLLLFVLCRPELKADKRLYEHMLRQPIDVRIKSLHLHCTGFSKAVDYSNVVCGKYHSVVNERNDLLHGNVDIEKLAFGEVYFNGTVPVFPEYKSMWEKSLGVGLKAAGLSKIKEEHKSVAEVIDFILGCIEPETRGSILHLLTTRNLGFREQTGRIGILFPDHLVDLRMGERDLEVESSAKEKSTTTHIEDKMT